MNWIKSHWELIAAGVLFVAVVGFIMIPQYMNYKKCLQAGNSASDCSGAF